MTKILEFVLIDCETKWYYKIFTCFNADLKFNSVLIFFKPTGPKCGFISLAKDDGVAGSSGGGVKTWGLRIIKNKEDKDKYEDKIHLENMP